MNTRERSHFSISISLSVLTGVTEPSEPSARRGAGARVSRVSGKKRLARPEAWLDPIKPCYVTTEVGYKLKSHKRMRWIRMRMRCILNISHCFTCEKIANTFRISSFYFLCLFHDDSHAVFLILCLFHKCRNPVSHTIKVLVFFFF